MGQEESVALGGNEIDAQYRPNVSYVPPPSEVSSESEMSDEERLKTAEGEAETILFKEEASGEEKKETTPPAKEETPAKEEAPAEEEIKAAETKKDSKSVQKRMNKMTFEKHEAIRRAERAETKLKERENELRKTTTEKARAEIATKKPNETDFESEAEYYEALGRWSTRSEMLEIESERTPTPDAPPAPTDALPPEVEAMLKMGSDAHDDFDAVVRDGSKFMSQNLVDEAMDTKEIAHDIIYYLAKNQDEASRIAQLSPKAITREIGKIEAGLSAPTPKTETTEDISEESIPSAPSPSDTPPKPKQTTNAPPPITPIQPGATTTPDQATMTNKEFRASRGFTSGAMKKRE